MSANRPQALSFLDDALRSAANRFQCVEFLKSDFEDNAWECVFGRNGSFVIDFAISLPSGVLLTQRPGLLRLFKYWLTVSALDADGGGYSIAYQYSLVNAVTAWLDYLLLHASEFEIEDRGLCLLTTDKIQGILGIITGHRLRQEAVYDWSARVSRYICDGLRGSNSEEVSRVLRMHPELGVVTESQVRENTLSISADDVPAARAWLLMEGLCEPDRRAGYQYSLSTRRLAGLLLRGTLRGIEGTKSKPPVLNAAPYCSSVRECPMVATSTKGRADRLTSDNVLAYVRVVRSLTALKEVPEVAELLPPESTLRSLRDLEVSRVEGRFATLPADVVFTSLRKAIEFHITYGAAVIDSVNRLIRRSRSTGTNISRLPEAIFLADLDPVVRAIGVKCWSISTRKRSSGQFVSAPSNSDRAKLVRANQGLFELLEVYFGAAQVVVGTLMARRQGELLDLKAASTLDETRSYILFDAEKTTRLARGARRKYALPIANVGADMISQLERIHETLVSCDYAERGSPLFARMARFGTPRLLMLSPNHFNRAIDTFCDYIETPILDGKRFYLRQHSLRRFFAMMFFWTHSFGGLETLRWFLGHGDVEHVYRYITETTPGAVLRGAQANFLAHNVASYSELETLLRERFGIANFSILDEPELEAHIRELIDDGSMSVEPEFFDGESGRDFKVLVIVKGALP